MLAMLTWARLPLTYWREAALTASYLYNRALQSLPPDVMLYEMYHKKKPNISHLRVFGPCAFAHVPLELQTKLGVKLRECSFMGYVPGQKGYRVCDVATETLFSATAVIFDENSPYKPLHDISPTSAPLDASEPIPQLRNHDATLVNHIDSPCRSSRPRRLTAAGEAQAAQVEAAKIYLEDVREAVWQHAEHAQNPDLSEITISLRS
jgi:hypothetical protein